MTYLVGQLNKQIIVLEERNIYGKDLLVCHNDLTKIISKLPLKNNENKISVSREEMENEILRYALRNKDRIDIDEMLNTNGTKYTKITNLYDLYLLVMLKG